MTLILKQDNRYITDPAITEAIKIIITVLVPALFIWHALKLMPGQQADVKSYAVPLHYAFAIQLIIQMFFSFPQKNR